MPAARRSRRSFLQVSAVAATAAATGPLVCRRFAFGRPAPSDRIGVGVIGTGNQGTGVLKRFLADDRCRVLAVCDVNRGSHGYRDAKQFCGREPARALVNKTYDESGDGCAGFVDSRELLALAGVDAVVVVTPDHHHETMTVAACEAGKDVYCEKPLSWAIAEGRRMVEAVREHGRVLQTGSMHRSDADAQRLVELVWAGALGEVQRIVTNVGENNKTGPGVGWNRSRAGGVRLRTVARPGAECPLPPGPLPVPLPVHQDYRRRADHQLRRPQQRSRAVGARSREPDGGRSAGGDLPAAGALFSTALTSRYAVTFDNGTELICETGNPAFRCRVEGTEGWAPARLRAGSRRRRRRWRTGGRRPTPRWPAPRRRPATACATTSRTSWSA